jgi:hypothetical protein
LLVSGPRLRANSCDITSEGTVRIISKVNGIS